MTHVPHEIAVKHEIIVSGGAGFLGAHLCERLLKEGHRVICVDNLLTGSLANIEHLSGSDCFRFIRHDIREPLEITADEIFNLACPASPVHYQAKPVRTIMTSVNGTFNLLTLARHNKALFLHTSTSEVYGDPVVHPQQESYWGHVNPVGVRACYDEGKRCAEALIFDFHRQYQTPVKVARIFNTYGPRMQIDDGRVVSNFIVQALLNKPLTVYGDGNQTRSFCFVDDLIEALMRLRKTPATFLGPINLGNPEEFTVLELARLIIDLTGSHSRIAYHPLPGDDPTQRRPDIELASLKLKWRPRTKLREGLIRTIGYFEAVLACKAPYDEIKAMCPVA